MTLIDLLTQGWKVTGLTTQKQTADTLIVSSYAEKLLDSGSEVQFEFEYEALNPEQDIILTEKNYGIKPSGSDDWINIGIDYLDKHEEIANYLESGIQ